MSYFFSAFSGRKEFLSLVFEYFLPKIDLHITNFFLFVITIFKKPSQSIRKKKVWWIMFHLIFGSDERRKYDEVLKWNVTNWKFMVCWILIKFILATNERFSVNVSLMNAVGKFEWKKEIKWKATWVFNESNLYWTL